MGKNISKTLLVSGVGGIALIALVGLLRYEAIYFFNGYEYTAAFSAIALLFTAVGLFITLFRDNPQGKGIGVKISLLAKALAGMFIVAGVAVWMVEIENSTLAWLSLFIGFVMAAFTLPLYGFGQLVDDVKALRKDMPD